MKKETYYLSCEIGLTAPNPISAAKTFQHWIETSEGMTYIVQNAKTKQIVSVDLSEPEEDMVLPISDDYAPMIELPIKEKRVFVINADNIPADWNFSGYDISEWKECTGELPKKAKDFINFAEKNGSVYTINGFMDAYNIGETIGMNDYIFITDKY